MIGKTLSVTKNVTKANLNEISTKGYDFFWDVARYGYEWLGKDALFYEKENAHDTYGFQKLRYDKDSILSDAYLVRHTPSLDTDPPWLVRKGDLELQQRQISKQTKPKDWKFVPRHRYRP